jgi:2-hydroxy-3-oxopropionate reductase
MCLPDTPDVQLVVEGPNGVLSGISPGKVVVDMSTSSPLVARDLAAKTAQLGAAMLDAPISGGDVGAEDATLAIMVGGRREVFDRVKPVFEAVGKTIEYMGEPGAGQITKVCNQMVAMSTYEVVCEALVLARKAELDPAQVRRVLMGGFGRSRILELHGQRLLDSDFRPGIRKDTQLKDLRIILETGRELRTPVPSAELLNEMLLSTGFAGGEVQ